MATLIISVLKLRTGDSFDIASGVNSYHIDIVAGIPDTLEAQDTSSVLPTSDEWITAVQNFAGSLSAVAFLKVTFDIDNDKTVITCTSTDEIVLPIVKVVANGSEFNFVSLVQNDGTKILIDPVLVPNVTVTSITHEINNFTGLGTKAYIHGNPHNEIETKIPFTTRDLATGKQIEFSFGIIPNTTNQYTTSTSNINEPFKIDPALFENRLTGTIQTYRGEIGATSLPVPPINFDTGSVSIASLGGKDYEITHTFRILDLGTDDTNDDSTIILTPSELEGKLSLKYVFEINIYSDDISPLPDETTTREDLTPFFTNGGIGWFDQIYNSPVKQYTLNSFVWDTPSTELNPAFNSVGNAIIAHDTGTWDVLDELVISIQQINDSFNTTSTLTSNIIYDKVVLLAGGTPVSSSEIINVSASIDGGDPSLLNVTLEVVSNNYLDRYAVTAQINDVSDSRPSSLVLRSGTVVSTADETVVTFGVYPSSLLGASNYNFNFHWRKEIGSAFNQIKSFTEDHCIARFRVVNTDLVNTTLVRFKIKIINRLTGSQMDGEKQTIQALDFPVSIERTFRLDSVAEPEYSFITAIDNLDGTYDFQYPFQIWKDWFQEANLVIRLTGTFTQLLSTGETVTFTNTFDSPDFDLGNYDETKNTVLEPQALRTPLSIQFEDVATGNPLSIIKNSGQTRVIVTFEDNNLNDLEVVPAAPHVYEVPVVNGLTGYLGLNIKGNSQAKWVEFHNFTTNPLQIGALDNPWEIIPAYPSYNAKLTRIDIKTAKIEAILDAAKLKLLFGANVECFDITGRLDAYQVPEFCWIFETAFDVQDVGGDGTFDPSIDQAAEFRLIDGTIFSPIISVPDRTITGPPFITANELNGVTQNVQVCNFVQDMVTTIIFIDEHLRNDFDLSDFTALIDITVTNNSTAFDFIAPAHNLLTTDVNTNLNNNLLSVDLSTLTNLGGTVSGGNCPLMTSLTFPPSAGLITSLLYSNCDSLVSADISGLTNISGSVAFDQSALLTTLTTGSSDKVISSFLVNNSNLNALDISGYTKLEGVFRCSVNPNMTSFLTPITPGIFTVFYFQNCDITGVLDLTGVTGLGGDVAGFNNANITNILWPPTTEVITALNVQGNTSYTTMDLSNLSNLGGVLTFLGGGMTSMILPTSGQLFTLINGNNANLTAFDITQLTGTNNNIDIDLGSNNMATAALDTVLSDLNGTAWVNGVLNLANQDTAQTPTGGVLNVDKVALEANGWVVTV